MFTWIVIVYTTQYNYVQHYYYYARYIAPYILVVLLTFGTLLGANNDCTGRMWFKRIMYILTMLGLLIIGRYTVILYNNKDDGSIEWGVLNKLLNGIENCRSESNEKLVSVVYEPIGLFLYYPVRAVTGECYIYNEQYSIANLYEQEIVPDVIVTTESLDDALGYELSFEEYSIAEEDDLSHRSTILGLPTDIDMKNEYTIRVYRKKNN